MLNHLLELDDHSGEDYVENEVEKRLDAMEQAVAFAVLPRWFSEYIDWDGIAERVEDQVREEIEDEETTRAVEAYEAKQEANTF